MNQHEIEALESDRDYFKHFSRLHETRAKASWKMLHRIERLIENNQVELALQLLHKHLEV